MAGANPSKPPPSSGKLLTVLSIDGGGIRGLIPAVVLQYLERELQKLDGDQARIADYFDVISGTSTGGLITAMLRAPSPLKIYPPRPKYTTDDIRDFYVNDGPLIFPDRPFYNPLIEPGPKHKGPYLRNRLEEELGPTRLDHIQLADVVIPTFDINRISPTIFSSFKVRQPEYKYLNALLSDICLATSAAPTVLPAVEFTVDSHEFQMIDGGLAAGNPTMVALTEVAQEKEKQPELYPMMSRPMDYTNVLVVSLGCGVQAPEHRPGFTVDQANAWFPAGWLNNLALKRSPLLECSYDGAMDTMDYYIYSLFKAQGAENNYLRVQADDLTPTMAVMDNATPQNLIDLENCGNRLLGEQVKRVNPVTFELEPTGQGTYGDVLTSVAEILSRERKTRLGVLDAHN